MPQYKVIARGFHGGKLYDPAGKRTVLNTDKPFTKGKKSKNPMPSWLAEMPKETPELKEKRLAYEKAQDDLDEAKSEADKAELAAASTEGGEGEASFLGKAVDAVKGAVGGSKVETL